MEPPVPTPDVLTARNDVERRLPIRRIDPDDPHRSARVSPRIEQLAWWLDESIPLPGTARRIGLDGVIGLIPGVGDLAGLAAGLVVVGAGILSGVAVPTIVRMLWNVTISATIGVVPVIGDGFDFLYKANSRNIALIHADLGDRAGTARRSTLWLLAWVAAFAALVIAALVLTIVLVALIVRWIF